MTVRKIESGEWLCDIRPNGVNGKRIRKNLLLKAKLLLTRNISSGKWRKNLGWVKSRIIDGYPI